MKKFLDQNSLPITGLMFLLIISVSAQIQDKPHQLDFGKMWTFDNLPLDYWSETYDFSPDSNWIKNAQMAGLQFGWGCSAAFVSGDGLIMTNHHCGRDNMLQVQKEGEDLFKTGFYAADPEDERRIPGLYVDQLISIEDVTGKIKAATETKTTDSAVVAATDSMISELQNKLTEKTGLVAKVVVLYDGGKYNLYGYKRYKDIRLVMAPEFQIASTGWDWDNFTYPRYELDFMFFRAYDKNGEPVKPEHFFKWSSTGAAPGELVFTVGRPGNTDRIYSVAQLEFFRDYIYKNTVKYLTGLYDVYTELYREFPEKESELLNRVMGIGNGKKVYQGYLNGLNDEMLMQRKRDQEKYIRSVIAENPELDKEYSQLWSSIENVLDEYKGIIKEEMAFRRMRYGEPVYLQMMDEIIRLAAQLKLPEDEREEKYRPGNIDSTIDEIFKKDDDSYKNKKLFAAYIDYISFVLGPDNKILKEFTGGKTGNEAVEEILSGSILSDPGKVKNLAEKGADSIMNSGDPFIEFKKEGDKKTALISEKSKEINNTLKVLNSKMGEAVYKIYGKTLSPDATLTLRISDGKISGYEYNGTIAPPFTTFYGMYDRYYSFGEKTYPWGLPEKWQNPDPELNLKTPVDFASTNDIVGGNSGSSVINTKGEVVGLVFDGNMESIPGNFIYYPVNNRTVAVDCRGLAASLKYIYKADKLLEELINSHR